MSAPVVVVMSLNLKGLSNPLPVVKTAKAMTHLAPGEIVEVFATDPGSLADFKGWAQSTGNQLLASSQTGSVYRFVLKKKMM